AGAGRAARAAPAAAFAPVRGRGRAGARANPGAGMAGRGADMKRPLRPRQLSAHQLACRNAISLHHGGWDLPWLGARWRIVLTPWPQTRGASLGRRFVMVADWGGARLIVALDPDWIAQLGQV